MGARIKLLRGVRFPCKGIEVYGQRLKHADIIEVEWPNGETDIMERSLHLGAQKPGAAVVDTWPVLWIRFAYQDWDTALLMMAASQDRHDDTGGEPFELTDLDEMDAADGPGEPELWGRA